MSTTVSYKGATLTTVTNATKTLDTGGTWLEGDLTLTDSTTFVETTTYTVPSDIGAGANSITFPVVARPTRLTAMVVNYGTDQAYRFSDYYINAVYDGANLVLYWLRTSSALNPSTGQYTEYQLKPNPVNGTFSYSNGEVTLTGPSILFKPSAIYQITYSYGG